MWRGGWGVVCGGCCGGGGCFVCGMCCGVGDVSVFAFLILFNISSLLSVRLILLKSDGSDLLIFFHPSLILILLSPSFFLKFSDSFTKSLSLKSLLTF